MPVFKVEPFLHQCIESLVNQTERDIEILLIDDGSPDKCPDICEKYAKLDSRIYVFHTENSGLSAARNFGLRKAQGEYIGFVDSDDWIEPDMFEVLLNSLTETGSDISACEVWTEFADRKITEKKIQDSVFEGMDAIRALLFRKTHSYVWNKLYKRECWTNIWFPEGHAYEDIATLYKVFLNAQVVSCSSKPLYHYRMRANSIIHTLSMNNLKDNWNAYYCRYLSLNGISEIKEDQECIDLMENWLANKAATTWQNISGISKKQRDYDFLRTVSHFVRDHFPITGKRNWDLVLRVRVFFVRYANDISFTILYVLSRCICFVNKNNKPVLF